MKAALIGCGRIGYILERDPLRYKPCTHYGGLSSAGLSVTHACDINTKRLREFALKTDIPENCCFEHSAELLNSVKPELVIIATWTGSHDSIAIDAATNGAKVIVLEKPITPTLSKAAKLIEVCKKNGVSLFINHERRYDKKYRVLKKLIDAGKIGEVKTVHASILTGGHRLSSSIHDGGGPLLHDGTHLIDIIRFVFGDIRFVMGEWTRSSRNSGFEDKAVAWCQTSSGIDLFIEAGGNRNYFVFELEISGTEGKIVIGNGYEKLFTKRKSRFYTGFNDIEEKEFPLNKRNNCFTELYREVASVLKAKKNTISSTGQDGYKALEVIHAIYLSSYQKAKRITLPIAPSSVNLKKIFNL